LPNNSDGTDLRYSGFCKRRTAAAGPTHNVRAGSNRHEYNDPVWVDAKNFDGKHGFGRGDLSLDAFPLEVPLGALVDI